MTALSHELLARLEAASAGKLSEEETQKLEAELAQLPEGVTAAAEYRQLWAGFAALRSEEHRSKIAQWDADWQSADNQELAEWYLENKLSQENQNFVERRMEQDAAFAELIKQQGAMQAGFQALKDEAFRNQMDTWGEEETPSAKVRTLRLGWRRVASIAAAVVLLIAAGTFWNLSNNYSDEALAAKYYKVPPTGNTMGAGEPLEEAQYLNAFASAHQSMQDQNYAAARIQFEQLGTAIPPENFSADDLTYYQDNLDWNIVLAMLGQGETGEPLSRRISVILSSPNHTYYNEAKELSEDLTKFWR